MPTHAVILHWASAFSFFSSSTCLSHTSAQLLEKVSSLLRRFKRPVNLRPLSPAATLLCRRSWDCFPCSFNCHPCVQIMATWRVCRTHCGLMPALQPSCCGRSAEPGRLLLRGLTDPPREQGSHACHASLIAQLPVNTTCS